MSFRAKQVALKRKAPSYQRRNGGRYPAARRATAMARVRDAQLSLGRGYVRVAGFYGKTGSSGELKFVDFSTGDSTISAAMRNQNLSVIPQNDTESGRDGRKCTIKSVAIRGHFKLTGPTSATDASCRVRCRLVLDMQTNGADFAATDLLSTDVIDSFSNLAQSSRFKVLMDKVYTLNATGAAPSGAAFIAMEKTVNVSVYKKLDIPMEYNSTATTGAVATQRSNSLHWVVQTSDGEIVAEATQIRIRFVG